MDITEYNVAKRSPSIPLKKGEEENLKVA